MINDFLQQIYFQNRIVDYLVALITFILLIISIQILKNILRKLMKNWAKKGINKVDAKFVKTFEERLNPFINLTYFGAFYISIKQLTMNQQMEKFFNIFVITILTFFGVRFLISLITYGLEIYWVKKERDSAKKQVLKSTITILKLILWSVVFILLLDNFGIKISVLLAGLGRSHLSNSLKQIKENT